MDDIDRDQQFNEWLLEKTITAARSAARYSPSLSFCQQCGEAIPEKRRRLIPGVSLCADCQSRSEQIARHFVK